MMSEIDPMNTNPGPPTTLHARMLRNPRPDEWVRCAGGSSAGKQLAVE